MNPAASRRRRHHHFRLPGGPRPVTATMHSPQDLNRVFLSLLQPRACIREAPPQTLPARNPARMAALHAAADSDARARARIDALYAATLDRAISNARRLSASRQVILFSAGLLAGIILTASLFWK